MIEDAKQMSDAFDEHMRSEFVALDVPGTMHTMLDVSRPMNRLLVRR